MGSISTRGGILWFDFRWQDSRCRESSRFEDTPTNRKRCTEAMRRIEAEITLGHFDYARWFPGSSKVAAFAAQEARRTAARSGTPIFNDFARIWYAEMEPGWRPSRSWKVRDVLDRYLLPRFGIEPISTITKEEILAFRAALAHTTWVRNPNKLLSATRINDIMQVLRMVLAEAADRYDHPDPWRKIRTLKTKRSEVEPFTLEEVKLILNTVRDDFRPYFTVRFFTGMRSSEIDGLRWDNVDFENRQILVREALVMGQMEGTKTESSRREVAMNTLVHDALEEQFARTGQISGYVFCTRSGQPCEPRNIIRRVWQPLLRHLGLKVRRPYQTRHTAATLWLAAGENPEWIARQMGHVNTQMLFQVYSRYVPNLTRKDGSAFDRLVTKVFEQEE